MTGSAKRVVPAGGLLIAVVALALGPLGLSQQASAADPLGFNARAQAVGVDASVTNPSLPIGLVVQGIGPEASSTVSSNGQSDAEASFPYVGPVIPGVPGIFGPLFGLPAVAYPFEAVTGAGDSPKDISTTGIQLHAESGARSNVARANAGTEAVGATSTSRVEVNDQGDVIASAESSVNAIQLLDQVTVKGVRSRVSVVADGTTGKLTRTSNFSIGEIVVPGLAITIPKTTPGEVGIPIPLPGVPQLPPLELPMIPLPFGGETLVAPRLAFEDGTFTVQLPGQAGTKFAIPAQTVLDVFKGLGITLGYQAAKTTDIGIEGATFTLNYVAPALPDNQFLSGKTPISFALGRANAFITVSPVQSPGGSTAGTTSGGSSGSAAGSTTGGVTGGGTGSTVSPGGTGSLSPDTSGAIGSSSGATTGAGPLPEIANGEQPGGDVTASPALRRSGLLAPVFDASNIYLTFVLVAFGALVAMTLLRLLGVRTLWS